MSLLLLNKQFNILSSEKVANFYLDRLNFYDTFLQEKNCGMTYSASGGIDNICIL